MFSDVPRETLRLRSYKLVISNYFRPPDALDCQAIGSEHISSVSGDLSVFPIGYPSVSQRSLA